MHNQIIECVPNFSEARRPEVIEEIKKSILSVKDIALLDQHLDEDHNRTVLTFVGPPDGVERSAFLAIKKAAELIDLNNHEGEHPRIGATDVVPFVPVSGVSMEDCVEIARRLGERVADELSIPVYLYEAAAVRPDRKNLENIRKGEYEVLKKEILVDPDRAPDFGPSELGPAGATVIGARAFLIAYNIYLTVDDVLVAKKVARAVRHSSGGLRYVKALGMLVDGKAQVSMNLTDFHGTSLANVVELVRREAARYGAGIQSSELVGLIPQDALTDAARWYLQLDGFTPEQILENCLTSEMSAMTPEIKGDGFLDALASAEPTPGGGSAAAYSAAAGAALVAMVARLTINRKKYMEVQSEMRTILNQAEELRTQLTADVERDANSYKKVMDAFRMVKDTPEQRTLRDNQIQAATLEAAQVPLEVARGALAVMNLAKKAVSKGNVNAISDGASGAALAKAAFTSAGYNIRINAKDLNDREIARSLVHEFFDLENQIIKIEKQIQILLKERGGFPST
jgi:glutamate formiminotransferase/formiminotetrahydrofolate cyclodeaminase